MDPESQYTERLYQRNLSKRNIDTVETIRTAHQGINTSFLHIENSSLKGFCAECQTEC